MSLRASHDAPPTLVASVASRASRPLVGSTLLKKYQMADRSTSSGENLRSAAEAKKKAWEVMKVALTSTTRPKSQVTRCAPRGPLRATRFARASKTATKDASRHSE